MISNTVQLVGGPKHGERVEWQGGEVIRYQPLLPLSAARLGAPVCEDVSFIEYRRSRLNYDLFLFEGTGGQRIDEHYCKWCETTWAADAPVNFTGDAVLHCPVCGHDHYRQFEAGIATGCNPPEGRVRKIKALEVLQAGKRTDDQRLGGM